MPVDSILTSRDCGHEFVVTVREQEYFASRGFDNPPGHCPVCRAARKAERGGEQRSSTSRVVREMFSATCATCGKEAQVPFQPTGDRPVYCSECYQDHRGSAIWRALAWARARSLLMACPPAAPPASAQANE
jgi:CxxC-x17-CxxC domain-containing protein